jgi:hypothetical protein
MTKFVIYVLGVLTLLSCRSHGPDEPEGSGSVIEEEIKALPELVSVDPRAREILDQWPHYMSLEKRLPALAEVKSREEMELLLEELNQICQQIEDNAFPEPFERPSVRSRQKLLRTYLKKLEAANYYRLDYQEPVSELMDAYNAMRQQFNIIVGNTLTPDLFEDD